MLMDFDMMTWRFRHLAVRMRVRVSAIPKPWRSHPKNHNSLFAQAPHGRAASRAELIPRTEAGIGLRSQLNHPGAQERDLSRWPRMEPQSSGRRVEAPPGFPWTRARPGLPAKDLLRAFGSWRIRLTPA